MSFKNNFHQFKSFKYFVFNKWVIDGDIKVFFDQISYEWILNNLPMPNGTKRIFEEWFMSPIEYQWELEVSAMGALKAVI
jgi:retron-type reverse transcriptase